jgi:cytolysin-activating lysine-acyltransferase
MKIERWIPASQEEFVGFSASLMLLSEIHRRWKIADFERLLVPPFSLQQFRCYRRGAEAAGLVTWAYLSDEKSEEFLSASRKMQLSDWQSGDILWLIDVIIPHGGVWTIVSDLRTVHCGRGFAVRRTPQGRIKKLVYLRDHP